MIEGDDDDEDGDKVWMKVERQQSCPRDGINRPLLIAMATHHHTWSVQHSATCSVRLFSRAAREPSPNTIQSLPTNDLTMPSLALFRTVGSPATRDAWS